MARMQDHKVSAVERRSRRRSLRDYRSMDKRRGGENAARIGADPGRFAAVEKWQLLSMRP
jgi:hypothetical protein